MSKENIILILSSIILWGLWGFFGKLATNKIGLQASFWNAISLSIIVIMYTLLGNHLLPIKTNFLGISLGLLAGICSGLASVFFYILLNRNPVGFLVALVSIYPLITIILSTIFLKEPITISKAIGFILILGGLIFLNL